MFKHILPKSATGRLYVGVFALATPIGVTFAGTSMIMSALLSSKA